LSGDRALFSTAVNPSHSAGSYTVIIPGSYGDASVPTGHSFGAARVNAAGRLTFAGTMADGAKVSQSIQLTQNGLWALYLSLRSGNGSLIGWMGFSATTQSDLSGSLYWLEQPSLQSRYYPAGFALNCQAFGSAYTPPAGASQHIVNLANADLIFSGGNIGSAFTNSVELGNSGRIINLSRNQLSLSFSLGTGTFKGVATDPVLNTSLPFSGAVFQKQNAGYGLILGTNQSSQVNLVP
jgi:hypothetical protein